MESPPSLERNADFVARQRLFAAAGLPVRKSSPWTSTPGSSSFPTWESEAWRMPTADRIGISPWSLPSLTSGAFKALRRRMCRLTRKAVSETNCNLFVEWFLGGLLQQTPAAALAPVFEALVANALAQPQCLIHRDYHCRNLLLDHQGRFGIVDFQDALVGPITYDPRLPAVGLLLPLRCGRAAPLAEALSRASRLPQRR